MDRCLKRECQDMPRKAGGFLLHVCSVRTFCLGLFRQSFSSPWLLYHEQDLSITKQIMRNSCSRKTYINCHPGSQNRPRPKALSASGRTVALLRILKGAWGFWAWLGIPTPCQSQSDRRQCSRPKLPGLSLATGRLETKENLDQTLHTNRFHFLLGLCRCGL